MKGEWGVRKRKGGKDCAQREGRCASYGAWGAAVRAVGGVALDVHAIPQPARKAQSACQAPNDATAATKARAQTHRRVRAHTHQASWTSGPRAACTAAPSWEHAPQAACRAAILNTKGQAGNGCADLLAVAPLPEATSCLPLWPLPRSRSRLLQPGQMTGGPISGCARA